MPKACPPQKKRRVFPVGKQHPRPLRTGSQGSVRERVIETNFAQILICDRQLQSLAAMLS